MEFKMPQRGEQVTIEIVNKSNLLPELYPNVPKTVEYRGEVIGHAEFDAPYTFRITGGSQQMPARVIPAAWVVKLNGKEVTHPTQAIREPKEYPVNGSKGKMYLIKVDETGNATCNCPGFGFRKTCSHIQQLPKLGITL